MTDMGESPGGWRLGGANTKSRPGLLAGQFQPSHTVRPSSFQPHPASLGQLQFPL